MDDKQFEIVKELAKQIPVRELYDDAVKYPAKEAGKLLTDIIKTLQLALPFQYLAVLQDRVRIFLDKSVKRVPENQRISPAPQILGPVLEGIKYEPENTPISEMFSQLLSRSMDSDRVEEAHPSYPWIIRQLSADEAVILLHLKNATYEYVYTSMLDQETRRFHRGAVEVDEFPVYALQFPGNIGFYMDHLGHLGLAGIYEYKNQEPISDDNGVQTGTRAFCKYRLTDAGVRFVHACTELSAKH